MHVYVNLVARPSTLNDKELLGEVWLHDVFLGIRSVTFRRRRMQQSRQGGDVKCDDCSVKCHVLVPVMRLMSVVT